MNTGGKSISLLLGAVLLAGGCRHISPPDTGRSAVRFVEPPPAPPPKPSPVATTEPVNHSQYREASLIEPAALPVYPLRALAAKAGMAIVGVNITVDATGRVTDIRQSLLTFTTPGRFSEDFREAVEVALHQWRFHPARIEQIEVVLSPGFTYQRVTRSDNTETNFELSFTFNSDGTMAPGLPGK